MLLFQPKKLAAALGAGSCVRTNPMRMPESVQRTYQAISQWAAKDLAAAKVNRVKKSDLTRWLTENAKMDKPVAGADWLIRGVAFMSAKDMRSAFLKRDAQGNVIRKNGRPVVDLEMARAYNITPDEILNLEMVCPGASAGCKAVCLVDAGQMGLPSGKQAQLKRQLAFTKDKRSYMTITAIAIAEMYAKAIKQGKRLGIRMNVTSDLPWENYSVQVTADLAAYINSVLKDTPMKVRAKRYNNLMEMFPRVQFYDYTKVEDRMAHYRRKGWPRNYYLIWSLAETVPNRKMAVALLTNKVTNLSVPLDVESMRKGGKETFLPKTLTIVDNSVGGGNRPYVFKVIDADEHDLRPFDKPSKGVVAGLRFKVPKKLKLKGRKRLEKAQSAKGFILEVGDEKHLVIYVNRKKAAEEGLKQA